MPTISMKIDTSRCTAALEAASKAANAEAVKGVRKAAKEIALPRVRQMVDGKLPGKTTAGATSKGGYVKQTHPGAGIDEFGGTRRDRITPKSADALMTPAGPRASVSRPRVYKASHALTNAARRVAPLMEEPTKKALLDAYRKQGFEVSG